MNKKLKIVLEGLFWVVYVIGLMLAFHTVPAFASEATVTAVPVVSPSPIALSSTTKHTCEQVIKGANFFQGKAVLNAQSLGQLYTSALKLNGVVENNKITVAQLDQAYNDMMGCFEAK